MSKRIEAIEERLKRWNTPGLWERADFIVGARDDLTYLINRVKRLEAALKKTQALISGMPMTTFPINVREPDGSISSYRPTSPAGEAYQVIQQALGEE